MTTITKNKNLLIHRPVIYPVLKKEDRMSILKSVRGSWKNMKPDPIKQLAKMRKEWDRKLPAF